MSTADAPASPAPAAQLRPPRHRVSPRAIRYWTARAAAGWAALVVAQLVWLVAEAYDGEHGFQLYEAVNGTARIRSAEHLVVRDGAIAATEIAGDLAAFQVFMAAG